MPSIAEIQRELNDLEKEQQEFVKLALQEMREGVSKARRALAEEHETLREVRKLVGTYVSSPSAIPHEQHRK